MCPLHQEGIAFCPAIIQYHHPHTYDQITFKVTSLKACLCRTYLQIKMATEHERYIDDYESGVRSGRIAQPPRGLMKFIDKIYEIQNHTCILPARLKELRVATPATASREEAQRIFDQFIDPLGESLRYLLDIVQTAYVDFHFARLRARRSGSPPAVLRSLDNLEALWREAIEEAEDVLDAARDDLKYHFAAYGVVCGLNPILEEHD